MAKFVSTITLLLAVVEASESLIIEEPEWVPRLKKVCQGTTEKWYVDRYTPRCCKCSWCWDNAEVPMAECTGRDVCATKREYSDCVYENDIERIKLIFQTPQSTPQVIVNTTTPTTTVKTMPSPTTVIQSRDRKSIAESQPLGNSLDPTMLVIIIAIIVVVGLLLVVISVGCILKKDRGNSSGYFSMLRKKICADPVPSRPSDSRSHGLSSGREEEDQLITECATSNNHAPPPRWLHSEPPSEFGPPAMRQGNGTNVVSCDSRSCTSTQYSVPTYPGNGQLVPDTRFRQSHPRDFGHHGMQQHAGNPAVVANDNSTVNIQNMTVCPVGYHHLHPFQSETNPPSQPCISPSSFSSRQTAVDSVGRPSFPSRANDGVLYTSVSPPLSTARVHEIRRQSSEISSTTSGPVENETVNNASSTWEHSTARMDQEDEIACHQGTPSGHSVPIEHCNTSEKSFLSSVPQESSCEISVRPSAPLSDVDASLNSS